MYHRYLGVITKNIFLNGFRIEKYIDFSVEDDDDEYGDGLSPTNFRIKDIFGLFSVRLFGITGKISFSKKRKNPCKEKLSRLISSISKMNKFEISRELAEILYDEYGLHDDLSKYKFSDLAQSKWIVREKEDYEAKIEDETLDCVDLSYDRDYGYLEIYGHAFPPPPRRDDLNKFCLHSIKTRTIILVDRRTKETTHYENSFGKIGTRIYIDMPSMYFAPFLKFFYFARIHPESLRDNDRFFCSSRPNFICYNHLLDYFGAYVITSFENSIYFEFSMTSLMFHPIGTTEKCVDRIKIFPEDIEEI